MKKYVAIITFLLVNQVAFSQWVKIENDQIVWRSSGTNLPVRVPWSEVVPYFRATDHWESDGVGILVGAGIPRGHIIIDRTYTYSDNQWIESLTTEVAPEIKPIIPESVTRKQFRIALILNDISLESVENAILEIEDQVEREISLVEWRDGLTFKRYDQLILELMDKLNLSEEQMDSIFIEAFGIE